jgi:hypothetical protein
MSKRLKSRTTIVGKRNDHCRVKRALKLAVCNFCIRQCVFKFVSAALEDLHKAVSMKIDDQSGFAETHNSFLPPTVR